VEISYTAPLRRAWQRMQAMLFRPFLLEKWLVIGLSAFMANLLRTGGGFLGWNNGFPSRHTSPPHAERALEAAHDQLLALLDKPVVLLLIAAGLVMAGILLLLCTWVGARARFVFLENVITGRGAFVEPWGRHGRLGHSLFLWYAAISFAWLLPIGAAAAPFWNSIVSALAGTGFVWPALPGVVIGIGAALLLSALLAFVTFMVSEFVVPLMLMYDEGASRAWARFWPLLMSHIGEFIAYTLFVMVVWMAVSVALLVAGIATCCIGLLLMMTPYVASVLLLPLEVTARAFGPEFLSQFGPEWDLFAARAPRAEDPAGPALG
jgi:hypothetical protein